MDDYPGRLRTRSSERFGGWCGHVDLRRSCLARISMTERAHPLVVAGFGSSVAPSRIVSNAMVMPAERGEVVR